MTSNTRVVVIGAGRAGARPARRPGELGAPVTPESPRHASEVTARPTCGGPAGAQVPGPVRAARTAGRADSPAIAYDTPDHVQPEHVQPEHVLPDHVQPDHVQPEGVLRTGVRSERGRPLLRLLTNDGGS
ncbi:hypothetical protein ACFY0P_13625 [Streptomyces sp. NPDC001714]|uniref:hypothetical protein n=1 Tax=Streptomyces sp. NPDC001714 TaxID=3364603 RepID=UPI003683D605